MSAKGAVGQSVGRIEFLHEHDWNVFSLVS
jgi:hypothetical protein